MTRYSLDDASINTSTRHGPYKINMTAEFDSTTGRYVVRAITITTENDDAEITSKTIRAIPIARLLRNALTEVARTDANNPLPASNLNRVEIAAAIYQRALMLGQSPAKAVAHHLGVPQSTAGRLIMRARDRGLLTVTDPRGRRRQ